MSDIFSWNGGSGDYADPAQWTDQTTPANTGTAVPGAGDTANFDTAGAVSGTGAASTLEVGASLGWTATVTADIVTVAAAGTLTMTAGSLQGGSSQTVTIDGTADVSGGTLGGNYVDDEGTLAISGTGTVADNFTSIGASGTGVATVSGTGASWTNATGELQVGGAGIGLLTATAGATITSVFAGIADSDGGIGSVTLDGTGTTWTDNGSFAVGYGGTGTLDVSGGAVLNSHFGSIGYLSTSNGTATVEGAGSQWNNTTAGLEIGASGYGSLNVLTGGTVTAQFAGIGDQNGGSGSLTVDGAGSSWNNAGNTEIGTLGGAYVGVGNGGTFSSTYVDVGTGNGGSAEVFVDDGTWTQTSNLNIGGNGGRGTFTVEDNASLTVGGGIYVAASDNDSLTGNGSLEIDSGSTVTVNGLYGVRVAQAPGDVGTLTVDGIGTLLTMAGGAQSGGNELGIGVGTAGNGTFVISNEAEADADYLTIGGSVVAYPVGTTATGTIESGAFVSTAHGTVGAFGSNASLTIDDAFWIATGEINIGEEGAATASVLIENDGTLSDQLGDIGTFGPDSSGNSPTGDVTVDGGVWTNSGSLVVGDASQGSLSVVGFGTVSSDGDVVIGSNAGGSGSIIVDDSSTLTVGSKLFVGDYGSGLLDTASDITTGDDIVIGGAAGGSGQATIEADTTLSTPTALYVGDYGDGTLVVDGAVQATGDAIVAGASGSTGVLHVRAGGTLTAANLYVGGSGGGAGGTGSVDIGAGALAMVTGATVFAGGAITLAGGTLQTDPIDLVAGGGGLSGSGTVTGTVTDDASIVATGGLLDVTGDVSGAGSAMVTDHSTLEFGGAVAVSGGVTFQGQNATLVLDAPGGFDSPILAFGTTDLITLGQVANLGTQFVGSTLDVFDGATQIASLDFVGNYDGSNVLVSKDSNGIVDVTTDVPCFAAGTRLRTPSGEVPVEALRVGDPVLTQGGEALPVRWIGRRTLRPDAHPRPDFVRPVRILRDAIAPGVPHADLVVSPDHALLIDGALVEARRLLNGATVRQEAWPRVTYLHVELERHAILIAEGMAAESYLDTGNRAQFAHGTAPTQDGADRPGACAPALRDAEPAWRAIAERARALGHAVSLDTDTPAPAPWLHAAGQRRAPLSSAGQTVTFALPAGARQVRLRALPFVPAEARPWSDDRRRLGLPVVAIAIDGAPLAIDDPALSDGWHAAERRGDATLRWTDGDAAIPLPPEAALLTVRLAGAARLAGGPASVGRGAPAAMRV